MVRKYWGAIALILAVIAACSNDEEAAPSRTVIPAGSSSSSGGPSDGGLVDGAVIPVDPNACVATPTTSTELLNECTDGTCTPFDNVARLPLFVAGQPLPAVP